MRAVITRFPFETQFGQLLFELTDQLAQRFDGFFDPDPQHPWAFDVGKPPGSSEGEVERFELLADVGDHVTNSRDFGVFDLPEKFQGQVQIVSGHPLDTISVLAEAANQTDSTTTNIGGQGDGDERSDGLHGSIVHRMMNHFQPPPFRTHPLIRGGHLQTIVSTQTTRKVDLPTRPFQVSLPDGDAIVLHEDVPPTWTPGDASLLLIHGLCGCHAAAYMVRFADTFFKSGVRVFRLDMRGCGHGVDLSRQLTHAGRSEDVMAALGQIAERTQAGKIGAIGVSLGGNQLLRAVGRVGAGLEDRPDWFDRIDRVAAVCPPLDLVTCSNNMERWLLRPYNYYFIRMLLSRVPTQVRQRPDFQAAFAGPRPKTLMQLDNRITAPLSGFRDAADYYRQSSAVHVIGQNRVKTLVVAAKDDPVVPVRCFVDGNADWPETTKLLISPKGGHVGFIEPTRQSWLDNVLFEWFQPLRK